MKRLNQHTLSQATETVNSRESSVVGVLKNRHYPEVQVRTSVSRGAKIPLQKFKLGIGKLVGLKTGGEN